MKITNRLTWAGARVNEATRTNWTVWSASRRRTLIGQCTLIINYFPCSFTLTGAMSVTCSARKAIARSFLPFHEPRYVRIRNEFTKLRRNYATNNYSEGHDYVCAKKKPSQVRNRRLRKFEALYGTDNKERGRESELTGTYFSCVTRRDYTFAISAPFRVQSRQKIVKRVTNGKCSRREFSDSKSRVCFR